MQTLSSRQRGQHRQTICTVNPLKALSPSFIFLEMLKHPLSSLISGPDTGEGLWGLKPPPFNDIHHLRLTGLSATVSNDSFVRLERILSIVVIALHAWPCMVPISPMHVNFLPQNFGPSIIIIVKLYTMVMHSHNYFSNGHNILIELIPK